MSSLAGRKRNHQGDYSDISPSRVLHLRGLPGHTLELDLLEVFSCFGPVKYVSMIPDSHQALLEYYDIKSSNEVVTKFREVGLPLANGSIIKLNFSTSSSISLRDVDDVDKAESPIIGITVYRANYPIHTELIHKIVSQHGKPLKILIIRKKNIVAFVEFSSINEAKIVKTHLNGADIYSGSCSLKVDFAPNRPLRISHNDHEQWDEQLEAINQLRGGAGGQSGPGGYRGMMGNGSGSLLGGSPPSHISQRGGGGGPGNGYRGSSSGGSNAGLSPMQMMNLVESLNRSGLRFDPNDSANSHRMMLEAVSQHHHHQANPAIANAANFALAHSTLGLGSDGRSSLSLNNSASSMGLMSASGSPVVIIYGLNMNEMNCERLFNIVCLYGNVARVKFLHSKEGACMVQMGDEIAAQNLIDNFSGTNLFGNRVLIHSSKQAVLQPVLNPYNLPDGSCSFKDFMHSPLNRFMTHEKALKNRISRPVSTLHFWNCPPQFTENDIMDLFVEPIISKPIRVLMFNQSEKSSSGLIEWASPEEATNALALCNHRSIILSDGLPPGSSHHHSHMNSRESSPWYIKLSYSLSAIKRGGPSSHDMGH